MANCASPDPFTVYAREEILKAISGQGGGGPWGPLTGALFGVPTGGGSFQELSARGYKRVEIDFRRFVELAQISTDTNGTTTVTNLRCEFGPALRDWEPVEALRLYAGTNQITEVTFQTEWYVKQDQKFVIETGDITMDIVPGDESETPRWSQYLQEKTLEYAFLNKGMSIGTIYAALAETEPNYDDTGSDLDEPSDSAYSRVALSDWTTPDESESFTDFYEVGNESDGYFAEPATEDWFGGGEIDLMCLTDASSGGNLLAWGTISVPEEVLDGDDVEAVSTDNPYRINVM